MTVYREYIETTKQFKEQMNKWKHSTKDGDKPYNIIIAKRGAVNSFYVSEVGTKFIDKSCCQYVYNPIEEEYQYLLSGEYCRLWLKKLYKPFCVHKAYNHLRQSVPNFYCGRFIDRELVYFDLVGAYHQIYSKLWLDFSDTGMRCKYPLRPIAGQLAEWKAARNGLVGNLASNQACLISGDHWKYVPTWHKDKYYNHVILYFCNTLLTELANIALGLGCCYIATDGFIFPLSQKWKTFYDTLQSYGIDFRCISGNGTILRFAAYNVEGVALRGDKTIATTKTYEKVAQHYLDNPILPKDIRKEKLFISWNRPLRHVDRINNDNCLSYWSKLK